MSIEAVKDYYNHCHVDYRVVWRTHENLCIHFGYFDESSQDHHSALQNMNRVMSKAAQITGDDHVLDAGCGIGGSATFLAQTYGARVTGVNIQPLHLKLAREEAARRGLSHLVNFEERNYCDTGLDGDQFDVVWALESVCHSDDKRAFVEEAFRLLKPGGRLVVGDFVQFRQDLPVRAKKRMRLWLDGWALPHLVGFEEFRLMMMGAGFKDVVARDITPNVRRSSRRLWKASLIALPFSHPATWLGLRSKRQTANVVASYHQFTTLDAGYWGYGIYTAVKP